MTTAHNETGRFHRGAYLVYLNGLEIPCPDVAVSFGVWQVPQATLSFSPHRLLQRLGNEDKVEVVIFYLDTLIDPDRPQFRLLFEGEIVGWNYTSMRGQRMMSFNAVADISILEQLNYFFMNTVESAIQGNATPGATVGAVVQPGVHYPFSLFKKGLTIPPNKDPKQEVVPDITRPFDLLYNVVKGMVAANIPETQRSIPSANFFSRWIRKRNFINRFVALPIFEDEESQVAGEETKTGVFPIFNAVQADFALKAMQDNLSQGVGDAGSLFSVIKSLLDIVFFELTMLPTAPCVRARLEDGAILRPGSQGSSTAQKENAEPVRIANYFLKPRTTFGIAPSCNVFFPSTVVSYAYAENYSMQPTRTYVNEQFFGGILSNDTLTAAQMTFGYPEEINAVLQVKHSAPGKASKNVTVNGRNVLVFPEEFYRGPVQHRIPVPSWFTLLKNKEKKKDDKEAAVLQQLLALYVKYEHFQKRYESRGGSLQLAWHPYTVPGFPCVIFDHRSSAFDTVGYVNSVQHSLSAMGGMSTSINYSYGRTIQEMFDLLVQDMAAADAVLGAAPAEPIKPIQDIIQDFDAAEQFYNALFFAREETPGKKAAFDFREVLTYENGERIFVNGPRNFTTTTGFTGADQTSNEATVVTTGHNLDGGRDVKPSPEFANIFKSYDAAMQFSARPICTIDEYITFLHGGASLGVLESGDAPQVVRENDSKNPYAFRLAVEASEEGGESIAVTSFYARIKRLNQGPGAVPTPAELGVLAVDPSTGEAKPFDGNPKGYTDPAQTRANWDEVLEAYRDEIYSRLAPKD